MMPIEEGKLSLAFTFSFFSKCRLKKLQLTSIQYNPREERTYCAFYAVDVRDIQIAQKSPPLITHRVNRAISLTEVGKPHLLQTMGTKIKSFPIITLNLSIY